MLETAFIWMLNCTLLSSIVLLYIMLFRLIVRKASRTWCYMLWLPAAFRLVCTWTPSFLRLHGAIMPRIDPIAGELGNAGMKMYVAMNATTRGDALTHVYLPLSDTQNANLVTGIAILWLLGTTAFAMKGFISYRRLEDRLESAVLIQSGPYPVYRCAAISSPFSVGIVRKRVYVPEGLNGTELEMVIAHEHTHLSRHDPLWKLIAYILKCIHWMNPLMHIAYRLWGADMELTCDERVVKWMGDDCKTDYCRTLLSVNQSLHPLASPVAFAEGGVKGRVKNLLKKRKYHVLWSLLSAFIVLSIYCISFTRAYGIEAAKLKIQMDDPVKQRLEQTLDMLSENPQTTSITDYFSLVANNIPGDLPGTVQDDDQANRYWLSFFLEEPQSAYVYTVRVEDEDHYWGRINIRLYHGIRSNELQIDPRRDTGKYIYLEDVSTYSDEAYPETYAWWYHYQTESAEIGIKLYGNDLYPNPIITALNEMMDSLASP